MDNEQPSPSRLHQYVRVKEWLKHEFQSYALNTQLPSDRRLAARLSVSFLTVNRAMRELADEGYLVRRPREGTFLAARESPVIRDGAKSRRGEVVFALPDHFSFGYWWRLKLAQEQAVKAGLMLTEYRIHPDTTYEELLAFLRSRPHLRGTIIFPVPGAVRRDLFRALDSLAHPVVLLELCPFVSMGSNVYAIAGDAYQDGYVKVQYLAQRGHRAIGYLANEPASASSPQAFSGMKQALRDHGLLLRDLKRQPPVIRAWGNSWEAGYRQARALLARHAVTAIVCDSSPGAMGCMRALWELGKRVPGDVSVIATELHPDTEANLVPPLTTVGSDLAAEIAHAFAIIAGNLPPGKTITMPVAVRERQSVAEVVSRKSRARR
jgi:DNA-binding LacI/PurR family transcriptional regulator